MLPLPYEKILPLLPQAKRKIKNKMHKNNQTYYRDIRKGLKLNDYKNIKNLGTKETSTQASQKTSPKRWTSCPEPAVVENEQDDDEAMKLSLLPRCQSKGIFDKSPLNYDKKEINKTVHHQITIRSPLTEEKKEKSLSPMKTKKKSVHNIDKLHENSLSTFNMSMNYQLQVYMNELIALEEKNWTRKDSQKQKKKNDLLLKYSLKDHVDELYSTEIRANNPLLQSNEHEDHEYYKIEINPNIQVVKQIKTKNQLSSSFQETKDRSNPLSQSITQKLKEDELQNSWSKINDLCRCLNVQEDIKRIRSCEMNYLKKHSLEIVSTLTPLQYNSSDHYQSSPLYAPIHALSFENINLILENSSSNSMNQIKQRLYSSFPSSNILHVLTRKWSMNPTQTIRLVILGSNTLSKTLFYHYFSHSLCNYDNLKKKISSDGMKYCLRETKMNDHKFHCHMWNANASKLSSSVTKLIMKNYIHVSHAILFIYDAYQIETFKEIQILLSRIQQHELDPKSILLLIEVHSLNDNQKKKKKLIQKSQGKQLANEFNMQFHQIKIKNNNNLINGLKHHDYHHHHHHHIDHIYNDLLYAIRKKMEEVLLRKDNNTTSISSLIPIHQINKTSNFKNLFKKMMKNLHSIFT